MTVTISQVEAARPDALVQSGTALGRSARSLRHQIGRQRTNLDTLTASWQGTASDAAAAKARPTLQQMYAMHDVMTRLQSTLQDGGQRLSRSRTALLQRVGQLRSQGWQVAPDGTVSVQPGSALDRSARLSPVTAVRVQRLAIANSLAVKTLLAEFDSTDRRIGHGVRGTVAGLHRPAVRFGVGGPVPAAPPDAGPPIPDGKDAVQVKDWWTALSEDQKKRLLGQHPEQLGNLNGIPVADRDAANQAVMRRDIERVRNRAAVLGVTIDAILADPGRHQLTAGDVNRYQNAVGVDNGLRDQRAKTGRQTFLYVYDPEAFDGVGRAAVAIGDPDYADNTAVVVPGITSNIKDGYLSTDDAANVYQETANADRGRSTAVIAWMGYDAPDGITDPQTAQTGHARDGGGYLASDVNALDVTNGGKDSHLTVIGHSYGSTTVSDACAGSGLRADDVVLVGSPGTDLAKSAADFHLPDGGHLYVGAASSDPVTHFGDDDQAHLPGTDITVGLGTDPATDGYGSTRFKAEVTGLTDPLTDHTSYFVRGSESLFSISDIASGHGDALGHDGMLARHRTPIDIPFLPDLPVLPDASFDPEFLRPPTGDHHHR